jgi:hypothetical protein
MLCLPYKRMPISKYWILSNDATRAVLLAETNAMFNEYKTQSGLLFFY